MTPSQSALRRFAESRFNAAVQFNAAYDEMKAAAATPAPPPALLSRPATALEDGGKRRGASRIPCPPPVAIGPSSLIPGAAAFVPCIAGLDKLLVSFWLDGEDFDDFRRSLQQFKEEFYDEHLCGPEVSERSFDLGWEGVSFNMSRSGSSTYPYKLTSGDLVLLFSNHRATASHPNCRIEIHSVSCWNPGWKAVLERFHELLNHLGCSVCKQTVTEHHITVDLLDVDFAKTGFINIHRWIAKARQQKLCYEDYIPNYVAFGKGDFMLRCYDKTAELKQNSAKKDFFYNHWFERVGYVPEHVTRIEFQIRRAVSKELEVNTIEDLETKLDGIWQYCVSDWCRFCAKKLKEKDRQNKHQSRYATSFLWEFVRSIRFTQEDFTPLERVKPPPQTNIEALQTMLTGCALSLCAAYGQSSDCYESHIHFAQTIIAEQIPLKYKKNRREYVRKMDTRRNLARVTLFGIDESQSYDEILPESTGLHKKSSTLYLQLAGKNSSSRCSA